jgi:hypothetical protein
MFSTLNSLHACPIPNFGDNASINGSNSSIGQSPTRHGSIRKTFCNFRFGKKLIGNRLIEPKGIWNARP